MNSCQFSIKEMLESIDIPFDGQFLENSDFSSDVFVRSINQYVTDDVARNKWIEWNPDLKERVEDIVFLKAFQELLAQAASLGHKLDRFKDISGKLPYPSENKQNWITFFEETLPSCEIRLYLNSEDYENWISKEEEIGEESFKQKMNLMNDGLFYEMGIIYPKIDISIDEKIVSPDFRFEWNDFRLQVQQGLSKDKVLVNDTVDRLTLLNIKGEETVNPANGSECSFIPVEYKDIAEQAGLTTWDSSGYLILSLSAKIRQNAAAFVNRTFVDLILLQLKKGFPATVELIENKFNKDLLVQILRNLLDEEISIRNLCSILDCLLMLKSTVQTDFSKFIVFDTTGSSIFSAKKNLEELEVNEYVQMIRAHLKREISHKYTRGGSTLVVYLMDPKAESRLSQKQKLSKEEKEEFLNAVRDEVGNLPVTAQNPVILTTMDIRYRLRKEIQSEFPYLAVLSYQELSPDMNIQPIARICPELYPTLYDF
jgi:type III secretory pathway component EscV